VPGSPEACGARDECHLTSIKYANRRCGCAPAVFLRDGRWRRPRRDTLCRRRATGDVACDIGMQARKKRHFGGKLGTSSSLPDLIRQSIPFARRMVRRVIRAFTPVFDGLLPTGDERGDALAGQRSGYRRQQLCTCEGMLAKQAKTHMPVIWTFSKLIRGICTKAVQNLRRRTMCISRAHAQNQKVRRQ
jgi:hypothetical protein